MMASFGIYSLKAGIILVVFWIIYLLFLQKETFYRFNRSFLLTGLIAALFIPLIVIRYTVEVYAPAIQAIPTIPLTALEPIPEHTTNDFLTFSKQLLPIIYLTVLGILIIIRCFGVIHLFKSIYRNIHKRYAGYHLIESSDFDHAFSFFRFVFIPMNINEVEKEIILKHEKAHIEQKHWVDLLFTNMYSLIWWFNPVIRFYEKAIRNNHEYLADKDVLVDYQQYDYQQALLNQWFKTPVFQITNSFSCTNNLKRINMMKKNISNPIKKLFTLLAIPAIAVFIMAFSEKEYIIIDSPTESSSAINTTDESVINEDTIKSKPSTSIRIRGNKEIHFVIVDGKEVPNLDDIKPEDIESISILKDNSAIAMYGEKGKNGVILVTTKTNAAQKAEMEQQKTQMEQQKAEMELQKMRIEQQNAETIFLSNKTVANPLLIVDGIEVSSINDINPDNIESVYVLKNENSTNIYGTRGKNGVILITTKRGKPIPEVPFILQLSDSTLTIVHDKAIYTTSSPNPSEIQRLFIVDGKEVSSLADIKHDDIASISILKDKSAIAVYGDKGKNGVILITTKKENRQNPTM